MERGKARASEPCANDSKYGKDMPRNTKTQLRWSAEGGPCEGAQKRQRTAC
jgi:hypothetical protein